MGVGLSSFLSSGSGRVPGKTRDSVARPGKSTTRPPESPGIAHTSVLLDPQKINSIRVFPKIRFATQFTNSRIESGPWRARFCMIFGTSKKGVRQVPGPPSRARGGGLGGEGSIPISYILCPHFLYPLSSGCPKLCGHLHASGHKAQADLGLGLGQGSFS